MDRLRLTVCTLLGLWLSRRLAIDRDRQAAAHVAALLELERQRSESCQQWLRMHQERHRRCGYDCPEARAILRAFYPRSVL